MPGPFILLEPIMTLVIVACTISGYILSRPVVRIAQKFA